MKPNKTKYNLNKFKIVVDPNMPYFRGDPALKRKAEKAKEWIMKYGLPDIPPEKLTEISKEGE